MFAPAAAKRKGRFGRRKAAAQAQGQHCRFDEVDATLVVEQIKLAPQHRL
jgi:hypothetical protein